MTKYHINSMKAVQAKINEEKYSLTKNPKRSVEVYDSVADKNLKVYVEPNVRKINITKNNEVTTVELYDIEINKKPYTVELVKNDNTGSNEFTICNKEKQHNHWSSMQTEDLNSVYSEKSIDFENGSNNLSLDIDKMGESLKLSIEKSSYYAKSSSWLSR